MNIEVLESWGSNLKVILIDGENVATLILLKDGFWHYLFDDNSQSTTTSWILRKIAEIMDELNAPMEKQILNDLAPTPTLYPADIWDNVPEGYDYIAIDGDDDAYAYHVEPELIDDSWNGRFSESFYVMNVDILNYAERAGLPTDYGSLEEIAANSLIKRPEVK